jgi:hypothetical protein
MSQTFHDSNNHNYYHIPCPDGITLTDNQVQYLNQLSFMSLKELKAECKLKGVKQSYIGYSSKGAKKRNLVAKELGRRDWEQFTWGERFILEEHFLIGLI